MKNFLRLAAIVYVCICISTYSSAQTSSGQISGRVLDPSGAAVAHADVTVTNQLTNDKRTAKTQSSGEFVVPALQPGTFTVSVKAPGFKSYEKHGLILTASERLAAGNIQLD